MTGDSLRSTVRDLVGVGNATAYPRLTDANINAYVNRAMHQLAAKAEPLALQAYNTQHITAADSTYELGSVAFRIFAVNFGVATVRALKPITFGELDTQFPGWQATGNLESTHYVIEGVNASGYMKLRLWPTPPDSINSGLTVRYLATPTSLASITSGAVTEWPEYVCDGFACYAAWRTVLRFSERGVSDPRAAAMKSEWDEAAALFIEQEQLAHPQRWGHCAMESDTTGIGIETPWGWG